MSERTGRGLLIGLLAATTLLRLGLGWHYFGFFTGDDVEILETGFRALGLAYPPWAIRNTLLPDLLVAPVLLAARAFRIARPDLLVWIASWPFVACATLNIYLLFRWVTAWTGRAPVALAAAALYGLHWIPLGFGSMAYPRTVSTTCVLLAALLVARMPRAPWREILAGAAIAAAFACRYSEAVFLPAIALLAAAPLAGWPARLRTILRVGIGFALGAALFAGAYEAFTWERPFAALIAFAKFTLIEKQASSLVVSQPWYWYLWRFPRWWCPAALPFLWRAVRGRQLAPAWIPALLPLMLLSAVHHKELRYLQGVLPFFCALAAAGALDLWEAGWRRTTAGLCALTLAWGLAQTTFLEKKSMPAVLAARAMAADPEVRTVAVVQMWAFGDRLYLGDWRGRREIPYPTTPPDLERLAPGADRVAVYAGDLEKQPELAATLSRLGFCPWRDFAFPGAKAVRVLGPCGGPGGPGLSRP